MRDNLEGLKDICNMELKSIKVSEELKLKTLEKCKRNKKISINKVFLPITCTIAACLFMGVIIYPIYNKINLMHKEQITMNTSDKDIKTLDNPSVDGEMFKERANITEAKNNKTISKEIVEKNQKVVNNNSKEQKQEKEMAILNEKPIVPFIMRSSVQSEKKGKDISHDDKDIILDGKGDVIDKEKSINDDNINPLVVSNEKDDNLNSNEEIKMKNLSLQEARKIFEDNMKIPSYVPKDFVLEKILVPEVDNNSYKKYEIIYNNNSQCFNITEYKDINHSDELDPNSSLESKGEEENNMIININKIPVKYILRESTDNKQLPYVKLTWEDMGKKYSVEGNVPWAELINVVSSILR